jgi:hypothetical protein
MPRVHPRFRRHGARSPNASCGSDAVGTLIPLTGSHGFGDGTRAVTS